MITCPSYPPEDINPFLVKTNSLIEELWPDRIE